MLLREDFFELVINFIILIKIHTVCSSIFQYLDFLDRHPVITSQSRIPACVLPGTLHTIKITELQIIMPGTLHTIKIMYWCSEQKKPRTQIIHCPTKCALVSFNRKNLLFVPTSDKVFVGDDS